ncbi:MAG TPA: hypothetical protein V6D12_11090 [Candidatus Obscuribacterales bacterium]
MDGKLMSERGCFYFWPVGILVSSKILAEKVGFYLDNVRVEGNAIYFDLPPDVRAIDATLSLVGLDANDGDNWVNIGTCCQLKYKRYGLSSYVRPSDYPEYLSVSRL